jgi:hypothetical protein
MANTRFNYDVCRTIKKNQESTDVGRYVLDVPGNGLNPSYIEDPQIRLQKWGANLYTNSVSLESELIGLNKNISRYTNCFEKENYNKNNNFTYNQIKYPETKNLTTNQSRSTLPAWLFRDLPQNDFYYLPLNPQENICLPFQTNLSTRILEKDYFVPKIECIGDGNNSSILVSSKPYDSK